VLDGMTWSSANSSVNSCLFLESEILLYLLFAIWLYFIEIYIKQCRWERVTLAYFSIYFS
jgi:hypothetical protein